MRYSATSPKKSRVLQFELPRACMWARARTHTHTHTPICIHLSIPTSLRQCFKRYI